MIADLVELENLDASDIYPRRINAKEVLITQEDEFIFPVAEGTAKLSGRDYEFRESTLRREQTVRSENLSGESHGDREELEATVLHVRDATGTRKNIDFVIRCLCTLRGTVQRNVPESLERNLMDPSTTQSTDKKRNDGVDTNQSEACSARCKLALLR